MVKEFIMSILMAIVMTLMIIVAKRVMEVLKIFLENQKKAAKAEECKVMEVMYDVAIKVLDNIAGTTVSRIEATQAAAVRKAVKAGKLPYTELTGLSEEAYQDIVAQLSPEIRSTLEQCVGDTEKLIRNKIEEVLPKIKQEYASIAESKSLIEDLPDMGLKNGETT